MARTAPQVESLTGLTPWEACQRLAHCEHLLFLDSAAPQLLAGGACDGRRYPSPARRATERFSFVSAEPATWLTSHQGWISENGRFAGVADPMRVLADRLADFALEPIEGLPPFQGGAAGLFSYDLCHHFEVLPQPIYNDFGIPDLAVGIYDWVIAFDHECDDAWLISTGYPEPDPRRREQRARQRAEQVKRILFSRSPPASAAPALVRDERLNVETPQFAIDGLPGITSNFDRQRYLQTIARAIEYTHAGDCFQVNIAQRLLTPARHAPLDLYERLRTRNPAPFAGYFDLGDHAIVSASPERFLRVEDGEVETRPIKGTRPRGKTPDDDRRLADALLASAKDRAENVMIVDLLRNDLGRVCEYGSVRVEALCRLESFPFVHHLVSEVRGRLRSDRGPIDLLRAAFPGGSVTGAPKIRAMEIIAELEQTARGPYCGSLGYVGFDGGMDTNLLIRTFVLGKGWLHFSVGGGIVADSTPEREYDETWHKAEGLLRALRD
ncbi:MAG: aminodeoxychorismate synthase component I [Planctomycetes bacterium]|nr:aminodeoxychorismate synthase component I [Planctomycetota bacterium]